MNVVDTVTDQDMVLTQDYNAFKQYFLSDSNESVKAYRQIVAEVAESIAKQVQAQPTPYSGTSPQALKAQIEAIDMFPEEGRSMSDVLAGTRELIIESNISVYHPHCLAHLHCPTFIVSLAAEMIISAFNQSLDSWDQAPVATMIEQAVCDKLCQVYGFGQDADAVFTGGGSMSNFMGMLLARDSYSQKHFNWNIQQKGLPPEASRFRIICAEHAHFTITQSASILGLGASAIVKVDNPGFEEEADALESTITELLNAGLIPIAYVTTAGTTDYGTIGDIDKLADCCQKHGLWIHVDAAYGGALIFSEQHKHKLKGIEKVDSLTVDFHKLFYQPISCGVFIVKNKNEFDFIRLHADYLNPESNQEFGILDLVYKSIQTTRRFDALKPFLAFQHIGIKKFSEMIDYTISLAEEVCELVYEDTSLELAYRTPINAVVFRYLPGRQMTAEQADAINNDIKIKMLLSGNAIIGQTYLRGRAFLKFTLLNPMTTLDQIKELLTKIKSMGELLESGVKA